MPDEAREIVLLRDPDPTGEQQDDLCFVGYELSYATSKRPSSPRWLELWIYATTVPPNRYVLAGLGGTSLPGEDTRHWAKMCRTPEEVLSQLKRVDTRGTEYLTITAEDVLSLAARHDEGFVHALMEWEASQKRR